MFGDMIPQKGDMINLSYVMPEIVYVLGIVLINPIFDSCLNCYKIKVILDNGKYHTFFSNYCNVIQEKRSDC